MNPASRLSVGDVLNRVFALYKEHFGVLIPVAFWLFLVVSILGGILSRTNALALLIFFVVTFAVGDPLPGDGGQPRPRRPGRPSRFLGRRALQLGRARSSAPWSAPASSTGSAVGIGFFLLIVPGCILLTIWAVIAPVIVIERKGALDSFGRSRELVRGNGWPVFGTVIVATLITGDRRRHPRRRSPTAIAGGPILRIVFGALASTLTAPIGALRRRGPLLPPAGDSRARRTRSIR